MTSLNSLEFDSHLFGRRIGRLDISEILNPRLSPQLPFKDYDLVQTKVSSSNMQLIDDLSSAGFSFCEGEIDFEIVANDEHHKPPESYTPYRIGEEKDITALCALAKQSFPGKPASGSMVL